MAPLPQSLVLILTYVLLIVFANAKPPTLSPTDMAAVEKVNGATEMRLFNFKYLTINFHLLKVT